MYLAKNAQSADKTAYTEQQINEYCKHADDGEAVQIIRQLQAEKAGGITGSANHKNKPVLNSRQP